MVEYGNVTSEGNLGHTDYLNNKIIVKTHYEGRKYSKQQQEQCFYHELTHAILSIMNEHELNSNEQFVDIFGQFLYQYSKTKE